LPPFRLCIWDLSAGRESPLLAFYLLWLLPLVGFCLKAVERVWIALQGSCSHHGTFAKSARSSRLALGKAREAAIIFAFAGHCRTLISICKHHPCVRAQTKDGPKAVAASSHCFMSLGSEEAGQASGHVTIS
jgi:hypothetical protein